MEIFLKLGFTTRKAEQPLQELQEKRSSKKIKAYMKSI